MDNEAKNANEKYVDIACPFCGEKVSFLEGEKDIICPWCDTGINTMQNKYAPLYDEETNEQEEPSYHSGAKSKDVRTIIWTPGKVFNFCYYILFVIAIIGSFILYTSEDINIIPYVIAGGILQGLFVGALATIIDYLADLTKTNRDILETLKNKEK